VSVFILLMTAPKVSPWFGPYSLSSPGFKQIAHTDVGPILRPGKGTIEWP